MDGVKLLPVFRITLFIVLEGNFVVSATGDFGDGVGGLSTFLLEEVNLIKIGANSSATDSSAIFFLR